MENVNEPGNTGDQSGKINWRQFGKHWIVVFVLAAVAAFVIWGMLESGPWLKAWQDRRAADALQKQLEELYRNDKYGGKTPEETYGLFIDALEKGDVNLASKYFVINKQEQWRKTLEEYKTQNLIDQLIAELNSYRTNWKQNKNDNNTASFKYSYTVKTPFMEELPLGNGQVQKLTHPAGTFYAEILFEKNAKSNVWKINSL